MKSTGDGLGKWERAEWVQGNLWDWIKRKMIDTYFYIGGYRVVNSQQLT